MDLFSFPHTIAWTLGLVDTQDPIAYF